MKNKMTERNDLIELIYYSMQEIEQIERRIQRKTHRDKRTENVDISIGDIHNMIKKSTIYATGVPYARRSGQKYNLKDTEQAFFQNN